MRRLSTVSLPVALLFAGCSLIVPGPDSFEFAGADGGTPRDGSVDASQPDATIIEDGSVSCEGETVACDGDCVDLDDDPRHCGDCGAACSDGAECVAGSCTNPIVQVTAGLGHACARQAAGEVWCWGNNTNGELGDGTTLNRVFPVRATAAGSASSVQAGGLIIRYPGGGLSFQGFTCATDDADRLRCWGGNEAGQLGDGTVEARTAAADVIGVGRVSRFVLGGLGVAVTADGRVLRWGGVDGSGTPLAAAEVRPSGVVGPWVDAVSSGASHWCAVGPAGSTYCWGRNTSGALGLGAMEDAPAPARVTDLDEASAVSTTLVSSCSRLTSGTVMCWGRADSLGAGLSTADPHPEPIAVTGLSDVSTVAGAAWGATTCAIHGAEGRVSCWGSDAPTPEPVSGLGNVREVSPGGVSSAFFGCALSEEGAVMCWGSNSAGQLGDGTTTDRPAPVPVEGLP